MNDLSILFVAKRDNDWSMIDEIMHHFDYCNKRFDLTLVQDKSERSDVFHIPNSVFGRLNSLNVTAAGPVLDKNCFPSLTQLFLTFDRHSEIDPSLNSLVEAAEEGLTKKLKVLKIEGEYPNITSPCGLCRAFLACVDSSTHRFIKMGRELLRAS